MAYELSAKSQILLDLKQAEATIDRRMAGMYNELGEFVGSEEHYDHLFAELCQVRRDIERYAA